jgi:hypothetical protein
MSYSTAGCCGAGGRFLSEFLEEYGDEWPSKYRELDGTF